jgi:hypothetical protein
LSRGVPFKAGGARRESPGEPSSVRPALARARPGRPPAATPTARPGDLEIAATGTINFRVLVDKAGLRLFAVGIAEVDIGRILTDLGVGSSGLDLSGALVLSDTQVLWVPTVGGAQSESCCPRQGPDCAGRDAVAERTTGARHV